MALPMLVGGADCGPSNPLQNLTKRFDQDRGIQQVCKLAIRSQDVLLTDGGDRTTLALRVPVPPGRYGSNPHFSIVCFVCGGVLNICLQTFRTQALGRGPDQDAARFFSSDQGSVLPQFAAPTPFDLSALHRSLPAVRVQTNAQQQQQQLQSPALASWATDFMHVQKPVQSPSVQAMSPIAGVQQVRERAMEVQMGGSNMAQGAHNH